MPRMTRGLTGRCVAHALGAVLLVSPLAAQGGGGTARPPAARGGALARPTNVVYVLRSGADTLLVERVRRTADSVSSEGDVRGGPMAGARVTHAMSLNPDATVRAIDIVLAPPAGAGTGRHVNVRFATRAGGGTVAEIRQGSDTTAQSIPTEAGAIPLLDASVSSLAHVVRRARAIGGDTVAVPMFLLNGGRTVTTRVIRQGSDSVAVTTGDSRMVLRIDAAGDVSGGGDPARGISITRADGLAAPRAGKP